jgi:hypothetical protein
MRPSLPVLGLCVGLAAGAAALAAQPGQPAATAEAEARALVLAAGLRDQLVGGLPAMAEAMRLHLNERNPGREADVRRAVEAAIVPAVRDRLDQLIVLGLEPLVRGFTAEELYIMRRFLELNLDQRMEGALRMVTFELDRASGEWLRKVAEEALAGTADARLRDLRF